MRDILPGQRICSLCGQQNRCFRLDSTFGSPWTEPESVGKIGCIECLRAGRFGFVHDTERGLLVEDRFMDFEEDEDSEPDRIFIVGINGDATEAMQAPVAPVPVPPLSDTSLETLRRTPNFHSWQDIAWLVHCSDFMTYIGSWTGTEFSQATDSTNGRQLFLEVTGFSEYEAQGYWPADKPTLPPGIDVHMFRCLSCGMLDGICDID